jgi:hypothetical protein
MTKVRSTSSDVPNPKVASFPAGKPSVLPVGWAKVAVAMEGMVAVDSSRLAATIERHPRLVNSVAQLHARMAGLGLIEPDEVPNPSRPAVVDDRVRVLADLLASDVLVLVSCGVLRDAARQLMVSPDDVDTVEKVLRDAMEATEHNPMPDSEWPLTRSLMTDELLAPLLGVSAQSIRRYVSAERDTPDDVAARLHYIALVNADLSGSYNERGIRRWWVRPRSVLDQRSPMDRLGGGFDPDDDMATTVRKLASSLVGAGGVS